MLELARTIRFCVSCTGEPLEGPRDNTFAGWPSMRGLGAFYEIEVRCRGEADPETGYAVDIRDVDEAVRSEAIPSIQSALRDPTIQPGTVLREILPRLQSSLSNRVWAVTWRLTPTYSVAVAAMDMNKVILSQHFEFAASHRLHQPDWSDEQNRRVFGKCNNPNGHGHNYRVEVAVSAVMDPDNGEPFTLPLLERIVDEQVIQRFDHQHLNRDVEEFAAINPSVENIARVCHDLLLEPIAQAGARLRRVTVWETEKTSCTYPAD